MSYPLILSMLLLAQDQVTPVVSLTAQ